ncbi:MAG: glycosyltransferase family 2 protein [Tannerella sp.]|jgi:GT2 family glycosyltransferase|nr:glycosyltransferase family 2 protein [Tannerella sp.]
MDSLLSVVIITWNAQRDVKACLDSVMEATMQRPVEIIVVDNGSTDDTRAILHSYGERINLILLQKNNGIAVARNIGMNAAKGEYIWILDVDTIVNKEAVDGMLGYLIHHPECGLCACRLQSENGDVQDSCRRLPYPKHKVRNLLTGKTGRSVLTKGLHNKVKKQNEAQFYHKELWGGKPFEVEYVIGACQMFRKTILNEVGYLDEQIFYGPEDADFCLRIYQKGYQIVCLPFYHIIHHYNRISNKKLFTRISWLHLKGLFHFYSKHHLLTSNPYQKCNG